MAENKRAPLPEQDGVLDLVIVGAGLAGLAAGVFAAQTNLAVARVGSTGGIAYTTGYLDILATPENSCEREEQDPYAALARLRATHPHHPYGAVADADIRAAFETFTAFLAQAGLPYASRNRNLTALSPMGTLKSTAAVPQTMLAGVDALANATPCLLVGFTGLKAFSAKGIAAALHAVWPNITPVTLAFPGLEWAGELYPEAMARSLEVPAAREALAECIRPHLADQGDGKCTPHCVGLPAVLGVHNSAEAQKHLADLLGVPVFEIPTLPPGVPGIRLRETLDDALREKGMTLFAQRYAFGVHRENGLFRVDIGEVMPEFSLRAQSLLLATGRFLSGGLVADRKRGIYEPLLDLPVKAPKNRDDWHRDDCFDPAGHPVNKAGLVVDSDFHPLDATGGVIDPNLYAAGSIVAEQDWIREKSGAGVALASAWRAVKAIAAGKGAL